MEGVGRGLQGLGVVAACRLYQDLSRSRWVDEISLLVLGLQKVKVNFIVNFFTCHRLAKEPKRHFLLSHGERDKVHTTGTTDKDKMFTSTEVNNRQTDS